MMNIDLISKHFGGDIAMARAIGVTVGAISQWRTAGSIPRLRQYQIEVITAGLFQASSNGKKRKRA